MGFLKDLFSFWKRELAIDLGTANTLIYAKGQGIVLREPSVVAVDSVSGEPIAVGAEAKLMLGKTHKGIVARRPMKDGVIENLDLLQAMFGSMVSRAMKRRYGRPTLYVAVPSGANEVERKAVKDAGEFIGASDVHLVAEPIAAAIGMELSIDGPAGNMVVDIGGGTTEIAIISLSGTVSQASIKVACDEMDEAISNYIRRKYSLTVGEQTAERIKMTLGNVYPMGEDESVSVRGQDLVTGLPRVQEINSSEVREALREVASQIVDAVKRALETTPPDLISDIIERGINLTGGGALLRGMDLLLQEETKLPVTVVENPLECVVLGVGKIMENLAEHRDVLIRPKLSGRVLPTR